MPWALRVLRAFLGATFVFAGAQKFLDANFLHAGAASYIGNQLNAFAEGTPLTPLMHLLAKFPLLSGVGIALTEIAIGLATLLGVGMFAAAVVGALINVALWLSATWHVHPYFLGSDSIYAVAWIALAVGVAQAERARNQGRSLSVAQRVDSLGRREVLRAGMIGALSLGIAVVAKAFAGPPKNAGTAGLSGGTQGGTGTGTGTGGTGATGGAGGGKTIATLDQLPIGKAFGFNDPNVGQAILFRMANGNVVAYSRRCTHAGCPVSFDPGSHLLFCPCHGAEFDPSNGAAVVAPPAQTPLQSIPVSVVGNKVVLSA
jgi:thiosulfate dehydrogenase [quinone] large subunit